MSDIESRKDIEARLDRALRNQVQAPRVDRRFDAAVWARIAQEEAKAAQAAVQTALPSRAVRASRWFALINVLGITATLGVAFYFALGSFGGMEPPALNVRLDVPLPPLTEGMSGLVIEVLGYVLGGAALAFGFSFTALGRRLRRAIS